MKKDDNKHHKNDPSSSTFTGGSSDLSLTASTESESFDTWTLVTDRGTTAVPGTTIRKRPNKIELEVGRPAIEEENNVEIIETSKRDPDNIDDLSDGISIISDNESAGRITPNPLEEYDSPITPPATPEQIEAISKLEKQLEPLRINEHHQQHKNNDVSSEQGSTRPIFFGLGIKGIFYLTILIAIAAFFGKMKYPEWEQLSLSTQIPPLTQRIEDLELQNNLLRAEIDILNKQVNYLNTQKNQNRGGGGGGGPPPIVVGGGNGDIGRNPYKQHDDKKQHFVGEKRRGDAPRPPPKKIWSGEGDIEQMDSIEMGFSSSQTPSSSPPLSTSNVEQNRVEEVSQPSTTTTTISSEENKNPNNFRKNGDYEKKFDKDRNQKYPSSGGGGNGKYDSNKYQKHDHGDDWRKDKRSSEYHSKEHYQKEDYDKYRKQNNRKDHSNENEYNKKYKNEKHENDWHEKMMNQREEARKKHEKHNSNNWYIERGNGREEARVYEKKDGQDYRKTGR